MDCPSEGIRLNRQWSTSLNGHIAVMRLVIMYANHKLFESCCGSGDVLVITSKLTQHWINCSKVHFYKWIELHSGICKSALHLNQCSLQSSPLFGWQSSMLSVINHYWIDSLLKADSYVNSHANYMQINLSIWAFLGHVTGLFS